MCRDKVRRGRLARCATKLSNVVAFFGGCHTSHGMVRSRRDRCKGFPVLVAVGRRTAEGECRGRARIAGVANHGQCVVITWGDGLRSRLHAVWLRDNCACTECRDPVTGQRLFDIAALPESISVSDATAGAADLALTFAPEGHRGGIEAAWLRARCGAQATPVQDSPVLWGSELGARLPEADHAAVTASRAALGRWLSLVRTFGFALLRGVPVRPGEVARIAELFGFVRETNYGRIFDVIAKPAPNNLAFTGRALGAHTDNPYRDPVPGLQLLHCLEADAEGGETMLVDGFRAAERLHAAAPGRFALLTAHEVPFHFRDADCDLRARGPVIALDGAGAVSAIRYNNRSAAAFDMADEVVPAFYDAYRHFARLLSEAEAEVRLGWAAGDLLILDNRRVLHGRRAYGSGRRRLQGCYADRDALESTLRKIAAEDADGP